MKRILTMVLAGAFALLSANIDGKWVAEIKTKNRKSAGKQNIVLNLQADGSTVTGNVSAGRRGRGTEIQNGKLDGDKFTFTTLQKNKQGEQKLNWTGTVAGSELKIERQREGAKRAQSFTAKKQ